MSNFWPEIFRTETLQNMYGWKIYQELVFQIFRPEFWTAITCSELTIETLEQGVKYVKS